MYKTLVVLFGVVLLASSARADFFYDYTDSLGTHLAFHLPVFENVGTVSSPDLDTSIIEGVAETATVLFNGNAGGDCEIGSLGPFPNASYGCIFYQAPFPFPDHGFGFSGLLPFSGPGTFLDSTGARSTLIITEVSGTSSVPEPSSAALMFVCLAAAAIVARSVRRRLG